MFRFTGITPSLRVRDLDRSIEFYTEVLGFELALLWPEKAPTLGFVDHGGVQVMLYTEQQDGLMSGPVFTGDLRFDVEGVLALLERVEPLALPEWGPEVYHYGRREFAVRDPDGYLLIFSEPTHDPPTCLDS
ncbi:MAG: VOC family protein [Gemmatimonadota bacterium]